VYDERVRATLIALLSSLASCYSSRAIDCAVRCGTGAQPCASGLRCDGTSGLCVSEGFTGTCGGDGGGLGGEPQSACATEHMIVMFEPQTPVPVGWKCVSCATSDPLFERFVVGSETFGGQGGSTQHAHTFATPSVSASVEASVGVGGAGSLDISDPTHPAGAQSTTTPADHLPPYRNVMMIEPVAPVSELPKGAIVAIDTATPPNGDFIVFASQNGMFIRAAGIAEVGGAAAHSHSIDVMLPGTTAGASVFGLGSISASTTHMHRVQGDLPPFPNDPAHAEVVLVIATRDTPLPGGAIAFFDATPGAPWTVLSEPGAPLAKQFLKGTLTPQPGSFGSSTHDPGTVTFRSGIGGAFDSFAAGQTTAQDAAHTHLVAITFSAEDQRPPYTEVIIAKLAPAGCP